MFKRAWFKWTLAIIIFIGSAVYQRITGPTHPIRGSFEIQGEEFSYKLPRSHGDSTDCPIELKVPDGVQGVLQYKRFKSNDEWTFVPMMLADGLATATLPHQPPAGKIMYKIDLTTPVGMIEVPANRPVVIRFTGTVPSMVLYAHILFMSLAMIWSNRTGIEAFGKDNKTRRMVLWTIITLGIGGLILGPIVQKFAFGEFWTGWPFGHDLTDNKTIIAFIFWLFPLFLGKTNRQKNRWVILAAFVTLAAYLIPHSVLGSELDYTQMDAQP